MALKASTKDIDLIVPDVTEHKYLFDVSQANVLKNFEHFMRIIKKEGILDEKQ
ncbi:MAG: hypothetical protein WAW67_04440 [Candidatus Omnitrophota bacterium]